MFCDRSREASAQLSGSICICTCTCILINPRHACAARVTVLGLCVCIHLMPYFSDTVSLHIEKKAPMASVRHCADYYKKGFRDRRFIQKLWSHLPTRDILRGYCSVIPRTFSTAEPSKGPKKANSRLNAIWNTTRCEAASFFSLVCLASPILQVHSKRTCTCINAHKN